MLSVVGIVLANIAGLLTAVGVASLFVHDGLGLGKAIALLLAGILLNGCAGFVLSRR